MLEIDKSECMKYVTRMELFVKLSEVFETEVVLTMHEMVLK